MYTDYSLDLLTQYSVSIMAQQYATVDGVEYPLGPPHRKAYTNSLLGRMVLMEEVREPYLSAILAVWGDTPTVKEG